jgi:anaerobic C4-dicarboxylate transporter
MKIIAALLISLALSGAALAEALMPISPISPIGAAAAVAPAPAVSGSYYTAPNGSVYGSDGSSAVVMGNNVLVSPPAGTGQTGKAYIKSGNTYYGTDGSSITTMGGFTTYSAPAGTE